MDNKIFGDKFWYGASCAPYAKSMDWPSDQWDADLTNMRKMGFNVARIFVPWDRIERREGELDFSKQDRFMELAAKHEIGVILNVGGVFDNLQGIYPPCWFARKYQVCVPQEKPGAAAVRYGPRAHVCLDTPLYREKAFAFVALAVRRYADHPATAGWMVWNEPWLRPCYCPATLARFRVHLRTKYCDKLAELNRIWGTEFPVNYESWEEVEAPAGVGFLGGGVNAWRDWQEFTEARMTDAMLQVSAVIKANDPRKHPSSANMVGYGRLSESCRSLDVMGYSFYTVAHGEHATPFQKAMQCALYRWFSQEEKRRTLVLETEVGPNNFMITPELRTLNNWLAVGHNAKSIVCWNYRSRYSDTQVGNFNLMAWDGTPTPRSKLHAGMAATFNRHAALLNDCVPEPEAAVLISDALRLCAQATHCGDPGHGGDYATFVGSQRGAFKLLWDMNITFDGVAECHFEDLGRYKVMLLPLIENMSADIAAILRKYVANGGTLIAESPFAFKDENNFLHGKAPIYGLDEVFGAFTRDREGKESASSVVYQDGSQGSVFFLWHPYELTGGTAVAAYADGRAAAVANRFGKGRTIVAGTEVFRQYMEKPDAAATSFLRRAVMASGVKRNAEVLIGGQVAEASSIEVCRLSGKKGVVYIVLNHNETPASFRLKVREKSGAWINLDDGANVDLGGEITLPAQSVLPFARIN